MFPTRGHPAAAAFLLTASDEPRVTGHELLRQHFAIRSTQYAIRIFGLLKNNL
jgi:hypothetical protein